VSPFPIFVTNTFSPSYFRLVAGTASRFAWRTSEGAILHLPNGASRLACRPELFKEHAIKHGSNWYRFAKQKLHCEIPNGGLYLITGTDKTDSWMVGAFSQESSEGELLLSLGATEVAEGTVSYTYLWVPPGSATHRTGPYIDQDDSANPEDMDAIERDNVLFRNDAPGDQNQCPFVRGYRISLQKSVWASVIGNPPQVAVSSIEDSKPKDMIGGDKGWFGSTSKSFFGGWLGRQGIGDQGKPGNTHGTASSHQVSEERAMVDFMTEQSDVGSS
jgi:hypothetical protein